MRIPDRLTAALAEQYAIERELGEGGMATVYLARDLKHNRQVAIKVLKDDLAAVVGEERFLAEIETTAQLQHPHILPLFDSGAADGFLYYAMPYVEGETLRDRLKREVQLPVEHAIELVQKIAAALDYAHEKGIVHRDIKPENILLSSGEPLISDFGIALAVSQANDGRRTETGISLGTPYYMSPEQAAGDRSLDPRSDIYALGCVLQELLTGEPPFSGANAQAVLARILTTRPTPVTSLRPTVPPHVESAIGKALEKLPADRFMSAKDFRKALGDVDFRHTVVERTLGSTAVPTQTRIVRSGIKPAVAVAIGVAALLVGLVAGGFGGRGSSASADQTFRMDLDLDEFDTGAGFRGAGVPFAVAPDGSMIAVSVVGDQSAGIWLRRVDEPDFQRVPNTEGGSWPDFSPDGEWLVFMHTDAGEIRKVTTSGGGLTTLVGVDSITPFLPQWTAPDRIAFTGPSGIWVASATSGSAQDLVHVAAAPPAQDFTLLPDGRGVLAGGGFGGELAISYYPVGADTGWVVVQEGANPRYIDSGHLLYTARDGGLFAVDFDPESGRSSGTPVRVLDRVAGAFGGYAGYAVAASGELVYAEGDAQLQGGLGRATYLLGVLDSTGVVEDLSLAPAARFTPAASPDGRSIAFEQEDQLVTLDILTGDQERLTYEGTRSEPVWSSDGAWILHAEGAAGERRLAVVPADGSAAPVEVLGEDGRNLHPTFWAEGDTILYVSAESVTRGTADVWRARITRDGDAWSVEDAEPYLSGEWPEDNATLSPQRDLVAHTSARGSESVEVYVSSWPEATNQRQGTRRGVCCVFDTKWSPDGRHVIYETGSDSLMRIEVERNPLRLFEPELVAHVPGMNGHTVLPDGRIVMTIRTSDAVDPDADDATTAQRRYFMVVNWKAEFERKLAEARGR